MPDRLSDPQMLSRLISFDSTSRNPNLPIADFICDYLDGPGVAIRRYPNLAGDKVNLAVRIGGLQDSGNDSREGLTLSGHLDVVPALEPEWRSDPFQMVETEQGYIGRGAADMKGFIALAVNLAKEAARRPLAHPLVLLLSYDEELGLVGAKDFSKSWDQAFPLPKNALIGEPTEMGVVHLHKGHLHMSLTLHGQTAHSAYPHLGRNAIEPIGRAIEALRHLRLELEQERHEHSAHYPETPFVVLNIGLISGGQAANVVPDECRIDFGLRLLPGMSFDDYEARVREALESLDGLGDHRLECVKRAEWLNAREDSDVCRWLRRRLSQARPKAVSYASDAGVLQGMGMDCVLFGPGSIEVAHKPNESMPKGQFQAARPILEEIVEAFCVGADERH